MERDPSGDAQWRRRAQIGALVCLGFLTLVGNPAHRGGNTASRLATVESLVHRGTFDIRESPFRAETHDYAQLEGRLLSTKPPLLPVAAAAVYAPLHALGLDIVEDLGLVHRVLVLVLETLPHAALLWFAWGLLRLWSDDRRAQGWAFLMVCFGFLGAGYATTLNNHSVAAAAVLGGLYFCVPLFRASPGADPPPPSKFAWAGLCLGLAPTLDLPTALVSALCFLFVAKRWPRQAIMYLVPVALVPVALHVYLTYLITGSVVPLYARGDLYRYPGSYWTAPEGMDALAEPKWLYAFHILVGHHGIFLLTPLIGVGLVEALRQLRERAPLWRESLIALVSGVGITLAYFWRSANYGGACVGFRWLIPVMPILILLVLPRLEREKTGRLGVGLSLAFFVSATTFVNAAVHPWSHSGIHWLFHQVMDTGANL